ncbi:MAG: TonB-dependent receptor [Rhodospirillales bacterium]|nr:TonB-dependent receptor [Rhodospirillales bacterium]
MSEMKFRSAALYGRTVRIGLLASTVLAAAPLALAPAALAQDQPAASNNGLEEIVVTAQKRSENLQDVPVSIQAFSGKKLEQFNVTEFNDYVKFLPSVTYQTIAPSQTEIYFRGVASGNDGNHSGPLPSVGVYLDELPVTTIQGAIDVHLYDIARVEALAGPQSTLYGASSQSGTLRIISNAPDPSAFHAGYDLQVNQVDHGGTGTVAEGFVNIPITDTIAVRLVGWQEGDAGYIDNVHGQLTFPVSGITIDNAARAKNNYNDVQTFGGRGAIKIELDDDWTITPSAIGQDQRSNGVFGFSNKLPDLQVTHFQPENNHDRFYQAGLTIQGKIYDLDVTYAGGYFNRWLDSQTDYTEYSFFYDTLFGSGAYITNAAGNIIDPSQHIIGTDKFTKQSHELRVSSPGTDRFHFTAGLFYEHQTHNIRQQYIIPGFDPALSVSTLPGTIWLTEEVRTDRDAAAFGEATYELTDQLSVTGGVRVFDARNSLYGFYGFGSGFSSRTGEARCIPGAAPFKDALCPNLNKVGEEVSETYKANISYKFDDDRMIYFTASDGYRPGGVNRNGNLGPYASDTLYNYEIGWKTTWDDKQVRWNGAFFYENWDQFQFAFLGPNSLTEIANAGSAEIKGFESDASWAIDSHWLVSGAISIIDAALSANYCGTTDAANNPITTCANPQAPSGQSLPVTPPVKANATARYEWTLNDGLDAFLQGSVVYVGRRTSDLRSLERADLGPIPAYASVDLSAGVSNDSFSASVFLKNAFDERGQIYRYAECPANVCATQTNNHSGVVYAVPIQPLTIGFKFGQKF